MIPISAHGYIEMALNEDLHDRGDITTLAIGIGEKPLTAFVIAKQDGVLCGVDIGHAVFNKLDVNVQYMALKKDGDALVTGDSIAKLISKEKMLTAERAALNFIGRLSGIATLTNKFVQQTAGTNAQILDTRKTLPGWRELEKYAVRCGGGRNHRIGLYDMFLLKENHIAAAGSITAAVQRCRVYMREKDFTALIEVEARNLDEVEEAINCNVDRIMLDNMDINLMRQAVEIVSGKIPLEASGNISLQNVRAVAETGVDFISIGAITHSAPVFDYSLLVADEAVMLGEIIAK